MLNGLYKVHFRTPLGAGDGVAVLENGLLRGGDSMMYYVGTYAQNDGAFSANLRVDVHSPDVEMRSVLGAGQADLALSGSSAGTSATVSGSSPQAPGIAFSATLTRLSD